MWRILLVVIFYIGVTAEDYNGTEKQVYFPEDNVFQSFTKFKNDIKHFFHINVNKIERTRARIKKAFYKFIKELVKEDYDETNNCHNSSKLVEVVKPTGETKASQFEELVSADGYSAESHKVVTSDGYALTLHRIISASNASTDKNGIILLHHGLLGSSDDWVLLGPRKSLPYLLINAGYDVWLANARGNKYSKSHVSKTISNDEFWNFSWHEIGLFDLAAAIDFIRDQNAKDVQLNFIGHSLGATVLLVLLSIFPQYNHVLKNAVLLAPLAFMYEVKGPLRTVAEFYKKYNVETINFLGRHEFTPLQKFSGTLIERFCEGDKTLCQNPLLLLTNGAKELTNKKLALKIMNHTPGGGSMKTILHYVQLIKSGEFQMFDLGKNKNYKKYGLNSPPSYRLNDITLPVIIFSSTDDWLSTPADITSLISNLPNSVKHHVVQSNDYSHTDFIWAEDAHILVNYVILDLLKQVTTV